MLPKTITSANSEWIQLSVFLFYSLYSISIASITMGILKMIGEMAYSSYNNIQEKQKTSSFTGFFPTLPPLSEVSTRLDMDGKVNFGSIIRILFDILNSKTSLSLFIITSFSYGFFYSVISSTLIVRPEGGISHMYGIEKFPYVIMMQYGPIGYTPSISIYLDDFLGVFIVPVTLTIIIAISVLVGFNIATSIYAFKIYRLENKTKRIQKKEKAKFIGIIGTVTGLFAACPSCASIYIFNVFAGPLSTTIASFAVTYYILFLLISIPLLVITPFIIVLNIKNIKMGIGNQCRIDNKR
jgi:hypothetical protein